MGYNRQPTMRSKCLWRGEKPPETAGELWCSPFEFRKSGVPIKNRAGEPLSIHYSSTELWPKYPHSSNQSKGVLRLAIVKCNKRERENATIEPINQPPTEKGSCTPLSFIHLWSYQCYTWTDPLWNCVKPTPSPSRIAFGPFPTSRTYDRIPHCTYG